MLSFYDILQINENASSAEIKSAYRKLCKILHPDLHNNSKEANVIFNLLHDAYETLSDPVKKRNYNPKKTNSSSYDISVDKYDEIISGYKKIVKDYERIIKSKNLREKELLEEIRNLKEGVNFEEPNQEDNSEFTKNEEENLDAESELDEGYSIWGIILLTVLAIIIIGVIILIVMVPVGWWILIGIVALPIWLFFSALR